MNGEMEERPGRDETMRSAQTPIESAKRRLDEEKEKSANREWSGWLSRLRENPVFRGPVKRLAALFLGIPLSASAAEPLRAHAEPTTDVSFDGIIEVDRGDTVLDANVRAASGAEAILPSLIEPHQVSRIESESIFEARTPDTDDFYKWNLALIGRTIEGGSAAPEYYARVGRPEWTPYQRALFADAPVTEKFTELHPEYRDLSPEQFVAAYPEMLRIAKTEFRFSNEFRFLTDDAVTLFAQTAPEMNPAAALEQYTTLFQTMGREVGFSHAVRLTNATLAVLPPDHPIATYAQRLGIDQAGTIVGRSKQNILHMDQARGELRVLRKIDDKYLLIDTFPAIGGNLSTPELSVTGKPAGSEFVHVPDTRMTVAFVDRAKTSWSWNNSWVPQGAPIREHGDELQYQHPRTKQWYDLTGSKSAFFPDKDGKTIVPFDNRVEPMDIGLIRAASHPSPDGSTTFVPKAWSKEEIIARNGGEMPSEWHWNDFGSTAIRLSVDGKQTNINIHSKPGEDINHFLGGRTHGCFATYGEYVKSLANDYGVGSGTEVLVTTKAEYGLDAVRDK